MASRKRATPKPKRPSARRPRRRVPTRPTPKPSLKRTGPREPVQADQVVLVRGRGTLGRGGGPLGEYWRIEAAGKRAGVVFINVVDEKPIGQHASIQIYLNNQSQGRQIGRVAYRKACEQSSHPVIYAHMRKSNVASRRAAEMAGFVVHETPGQPQLTMVWRRP